MSHYIIRIIGCLLSLLIIWIKPWLGLFFFIFYIFEVFYFWEILLKLKYKGKEYCCIKIEYMDVCDSSFLEIWREYSYHQAFKRIYFILSKKRQGWKNIVWGILIFMSGIPVRFVRLIYYFTTEKNKFRINLELLYIRSYYELRECKIEALNSKIFLNCYTLGKLVRGIRLTNTNMNVGECFDIIHDLKKAAINFDRYEKRNESYIKMSLTEAYDDENILLYPYHYAYISKGNSVHATSNIPKKIALTQRIDVSIPSLTLKNAKNPGTVVTKGGKYYENYKGIWIPVYEIESIKFSHLDLFDLEKENYKYIYEKNDIYERIVKEKAKILTSEGINIIKELRTNNYTNILINASNKDIAREIVDIFENTDPFNKY